MTDKEWFDLCTEYNSSYDESHDSLRVYADWVEENGKNYHEGLRILADSTLFDPRQLKTKITIQEYTIREKTYNVMFQDILSLFGQQMNEEWAGCIRTAMWSRTQDIFRSYLLSQPHRFASPEQILIAIAEGTQEFVRWKEGK